MSIAGLAPVQGAAGAAAAPQSQRAQTLRAASMLEGLFLHQLMKVMRESVPESSLFGESLGQNIFTQMFDQAVVDEASRGGGGFGLRDVLFQQLDAASRGSTRPLMRPAGAALTPSVHPPAEGLRQLGRSPQQAATAFRQVAALGQQLGGVGFEAPDRPSVAPRDTDGQLHWPLDAPPRLDAAGMVVGRPGAEVLAAGSGRVVAADQRSLVVDHGHELRTRYVGLGQVLAQVGDLVLRGQTLGSLASGGTFQLSAEKAQRVLQPSGMATLFGKDATRGGSSREDAPR